METITINGVKQPVKTANGVRYYQNWDNSEGGICMIKPKTINRYWEIRNEQPKADHYGVFFAFGEKQFEEGRKRLIRDGYLKEGDKVCSAGAGMYGTESEINRYFKFYDERGKRIGKECDPQEVYFCEWNNHECMISMDDDEALKCVISYFGKEAAHKIVRLYPCTPTNVLAPLTRRDRHLGEYGFELRMLSRLKYDMEGFFDEGGDCRRRRTDCLWGGCVKREMQEMRDLYRKLPDDIKDASCLSHEEIEDYCKRLEQWSEEEFSKPEYDPVPRTELEELPGEIVLDNPLYYKDDEGKLQKPTHIWFSSDTRRLHKDDRCVHGRAMTSYLGKKGTTLAEVFFLGLVDWDQCYRRKDLCDVSCKVVKDGWRTKLCDFHYE